MKRILLTSKGICNQEIERAFFSLLIKPIDQCRVAIIPTAAVKEKKSHPRVVQAKDQFIEFGAKEVTCIDIEDDPAKNLEKYDVIYLAGGNPFYLLYHLKKSGADNMIMKSVDTDTVIVGTSAGALVLGPHIKIVRYLTPLIEEGIVLDNINGLGAFSFPIMPHSNREDLFPHETSLEERLDLFEKETEEKVERIKDEEAMVVKGSHVYKIMP